MASRPYRQLDRYFAGDLSAPAQRELSQAALDDPELFEVLTAAAVAHDMIERERGSPGEQGKEFRAWPVPPTDAARAPAGASIWHLTGRRRALAAAGLAAAASIVVVVMVQRSSSPIERPPAIPSSPAATATAPGPAATPDSPMAALSPLMLTAVGSEMAGLASAEFRASGAESRSPKSEGVVVSSEDDVVTVDVGSLDGIEHGSVLLVHRADLETPPTGRLTITRVFRERATGKVAPAGSVQPGDRVEIPAAMEVAAHLEQVAARVAAGDIDTAQALALRAESISRSAGVRSDLRRRALAELGSLEYRTGALDQAERHLSSAAEDFDVAPAATATERARLLNELGAVLVGRGNHTEAERVLRLAEAQATGLTRVRVLNNLAGVIALRGDLVTAEATYRAALAEAAKAPVPDSDRRAIEKNLESLKTPE